MLLYKLFNRVFVFTKISCKKAVQIIDLYQIKSEATLGFAFYYLFYAFIKDCLLRPGYSPYPPSNSV